MNSIFQPVDLCLLSPAVSAYTAARSVLVSRLTSTCKPLDQHLSAVRPVEVDRMERNPSKLLTLYKEGYELAAQIEFEI